MTKWRSILAEAVMLLSLVALSAWYFMPIYSDEIAFRTQVGRYIQDQGVMHGLYALCSSNVKDTPILFTIPAWLFSKLDLTLSPIEIRILPFVTVLTTLGLTVWYAVRGKNPLASIAVTTSFVGVAGSGLIMARYEYVQEVNILFCLAVLLYLKMPSQKLNLRYVLFVLLVTSCLTSIYAHIQGLLFLPLTLYLAYRLIVPDVGKSRASVLMAVLFFFIAVNGVLFQRANCDGYPEIVRFWADMTFTWSDIDASKITDWLQTKYSKYQTSFIYKNEYAANYLPALNVEGGWQQVLLLILNKGIQSLLLVNLLFTFAVAIFLLPLLVLRSWSSNVSAKVVLFAVLNRAQVMVPILLALPVVFLYFYDTSQNFYRSFFLNFVVSIVLTLTLARGRTVSLRLFVNLYLLASVLLVVACVLANFVWFTGKLRSTPGFEGPSISLRRDWPKIHDDVLSLAQICTMDLAKGRIILDDMTYDVLKQYSNIYPITYIALQAEVSKLPMNELILKVRPNYAIARCSAMEYTKISKQHQLGELCCFNFNEPVSGK